MIYLEIYIVRPGDTVYSIAKKFGVSAQRIVSDNMLAYDRGLAVGQALLILFPEVVHTFRTGETLYSAARMYGTDVMQLLRNNPTLTGMKYIPEGTQIVISYRGRKLSEKETSGFAYSYIDPAVLASALPYLTYIIIFGYGFTESGEIINVNDSRIISAAHDSGTAVLLCLSSINTDGTFDTGKIGKLLTDTDFQNIVISDLIDTIIKKDAQGLDIDIEYIPAEYREAFAAFAENARRRLGEYGLTVHVDLAPKISPVQKGALYEAHDYELLGSAADLVFLMTYEWGYTYGPPMAVAPLPNVRRVLEYALTEIPAEKIFLGIPNYGYDWKIPYERGITKAVTMGNIGAAQLAVSTGSEIIFDNYSQSPYFYYTDIFGEKHVVWFEDVRSLREKFLLAEEKGIRGCGYWNIMRPFPQNYLLLNSLFGISKIL